MTWVNFHHLLQTVVFNKVEFLFFPGKFRDAAMRKMTSRDNTNSTKGKAKFQVSTNIYFMEMNNHDKQNNRHSKIYLIVKVYAEGVKILQCYFEEFVPLR